MTSFVTSVVLVICVISGMKADTGFSIRETDLRRFYQLFEDTSSIPSVTRIMYPCYAYSNVTGDGVNTLPVDRLLLDVIYFQMRKRLTNIIEI